VSAVCIVITNTTKWLHINWTAHQRFTALCCRHCFDICTFDHFCS